MNFLGVGILKDLSDRIDSVFGTRLASPVGAYQA